MPAKTTLRIDGTTIGSPRALIDCATDIAITGKGSRSLQEFGVFFYLKMHGLRQQITPKYYSTWKTFPHFVHFKLRFSIPLT
jgi:hypothetical protein